MVSTLTTAFIADNDTNDVLVSSSPDGLAWANNTQVGQSSRAAPSLAEFNTEFWPAFIADNDTGDVLVCSSPDGVHWSANTQVGQSSQAAPSLAVFNGMLWLAFIADNDTRDVLVCSSPDGLAWTSNTRLGQSSKWAPSLLALVLTVGQVRPLYYLLTVIYAPPGGTNADGAASSVSYLDGSTTGTTTSNSSSFKAGVGVTASIGANQGGVSADDTAAFTASQTTTNSSSLQIQKNVSYSIQVKGPAQDGIDHDYDTFWLWLNPLLSVTMDPYNNLNWELGIDGPTMDIQYVYASWLKDPELMQAQAPGVFTEISARGLTTADFDQILATNPFTSPKPTFDPDRYLPTTLSFPYEPPPDPGDTPPAETYVATNSVTKTDRREVQVQYGVTFTSTASLVSDINAALNTEGSLEWTDTSSVETSDESLQTATVIVGGPAYGYSGPTNVLVYWDTIFSSFMFAFAENPVASGTVVDGAGEPIAHEPITLAVGGHILHTSTDARGEFRFYGTTPVQGKPAVDGNESPVAAGSGDEAASPRRRSGGNGATRARPATTRSAATGRARQRP